MSDPRVRYALSILLGTATPEDLPIIYGNTGDLEEGAPAVHIIPSGFFGPQYGTGASLPEMPLHRTEDVPLLFGRPEVVRRGSRLIVCADVVASAYFLVTRYEEWVRRGVRDHHGRFPGKESLPYRAGFLDRPIVEEYSNLLRRWAGEAGIELPAPRRRFSVLLTHDIDSIGIRHTPIQAARSIAAGLLRRRPWRDAIRNAAIAIGLVPDPNNNVDEVLRIDERLSGRAPGVSQPLFFLMAGGKSLFDGAYSLRGRAARNVVHHLRQSGAEIGLHASYEAGQRPELLSGERALLEHAVGMPVHKNRHHYLNWREPEDGHALAAAGIRWDSTLGYADVPGFRLGVCHPIPLFDPVHCRPLGIEEHPLLVMDTTLSNPGYLGLADEEAALEVVRRLADVTWRHRGEFVTLWHNQSLARTDGDYHKRLYPRVLDYLGQLLRQSAGENGLDERRLGGH